jgi:hypothetical protein
LVCLLLAGIIVVGAVHRASPAAIPAPTSPPPVAPRYGDPQAAFDAFFGGQSSLGNGYYHSCVPAENGTGSAIPSLRVVFTAAGNADQIAWQACRDDHVASWRDGATPYLPADAHLIQSQPGTQDVEIDVYSSAAAGAATGTPTFTLAGGPGLRFTLVPGNALP